MNAPNLIVFDSGLGGLTVYREVVAALPHARYLYVAEQRASAAPRVLVYEPELDPETRLVLQTNGEIISVSSLVLTQRLAEEKKP